MIPLGIGFWSWQISGLIWVAIVLVWACGIYDLMAKRPDLDGRHRAAWILLIVIFPIVGTIGYFIVRPTLPAEREQMVAAARGLRENPTPYR